VKDFLHWLRTTDLVSLAFEAGLAVFILVSFVRCALPE
jgi:hypothetical protein